MSKALIHFSVGYKQVSKGKNLIQTNINHAISVYRVVTREISTRNDLTTDIEMAIVFRSLILFLTVLQSFTFGRYPPLPPFLEKNSNGKSGISLPVTVCIVHVQNICQALSKHDRTTYDLASYQHT